jgi:hypothetical protein
MGLDEVRKSEDHEYIGSEGGEDIRKALPGNDGWLANPHEQQDMHHKCARTAYRIHFDDKIDDRVRFRKDVKALEGKTLVCHCAPGPCHGEVILDYLDDKAREQELNPLLAALEPIEGVGEKTIAKIHEEIGDLETVAETTPDHIARKITGISRETAEEIIATAEDDPDD